MRKFQKSHREVPRPPGRSSIKTSDGMNVREGGCIISFFPQHPQSNPLIYGPVDKLRNHSPLEGGVSELRAKTRKRTGGGSIGTEEGAIAPFKSGSPSFLSRGNSSFISREILASRSNFTPHASAFAQTARLLLHSLPPWSEMTLKGGVFLSLSSIASNPRSSGLFQQPLLGRQSLILQSRLTLKGGANRADTLVPGQAPAPDRLRKTETPIIRQIHPPRSVDFSRIGRNRTAIPRNCRTP